MNDWSKMHDVNLGATFAKDAMSLLQAQKDKEVPQEECKHKYRVANGLHVAIKWCIEPGCTKSWRLPTQGDYTGYSGGDYPDSVWEELTEEPAKEAVPILPPYEE